MNSSRTVSALDIKFLAEIRASVNRFMADAASRFAQQPGLLLDVAPQVYAGARPFFPAHVEIETLDIDPKAGCTHTADLCECSDTRLLERFDYIVCTEVLEHTRQPFHAADQLLRMLKPGGLCFVTTPFNFRIHGPLPDCWRFTEHGLKELFRKFEIVELSSVEDPDRFLMPIHYCLVARKLVS
jgi:hypothetical protein